MSIKLRFSSMENLPEDRERQIVDGTILETAVLDICENVKLGESELEDIFQVLHNGHRIEPEFWGSVRLLETDHVLVAPILRGGGDDSGTFKQLAILAITVAAAAAFATVPGPGTAASWWMMGGSPMAAAFATAGVSLAASLALNALIPPEVHSFGDIGNFGDSSVEASQTYNIASQSNRVKQYGSVPKTYGRHRTFPNIAANPYIQLEIDPASGKSAQYLYAIYDFGLGPMDVKDIKIGDTDLTEFLDFRYALVDPNKGAVSTGVWDDVLASTFELYKSDNSIESVGVTLDKNLSEGGSSVRYQATRTSAANSDLLDNEIILSLVNPSGLFAYTPTNVLVNRRIELQVEFRMVGETQWRFYNDRTYVKYFRAVGGTTNPEGTINPTLLGPGIYQPFPTMSPNRYPTKGERTKYNITNDYQMVFDKTYSINKGAPYIPLVNDLNVVVGSRLSFGNQKGNASVMVTNVVRAGATMTVYFDQPLPQTIVLYKSLTPAEGGSDYAGSLQTMVTLYADLNLLGRAILEKQETVAAYSEVAFTPRQQGSFEVRVTRLLTTSTYDTQKQDTLTWYSINTRLNRPPIATDKRHVFMEVKIRATNQLNGTIQNLSAVCTSALDVWNGSAWVKQLTSNPAWVFADLLTGEINKKAVAKSRLDVVSLKEWADFCDEVPTSPPGAVAYKAPRFETNFILDYTSTLQKSLNQVANACQASLNLVDGKYGVLIDKRVTTPVQVFTPRNSKGFSSSRVYSPRPHGLNVKYVDCGADWETRDVQAYDNGYNETNATDMEDVTSFACTSKEQAWRLGRYMLAQNRLRQETISIDVDFEYLVCARGDYVKVTQDIMRVGGRPARVKSVVGVRIVIDDSMDIDPELSYGYTVRKATGDIVTSTLTVVGSDTFDLAGTLPEVGDLIVIGAVGEITYDCVVKSITPSDELSASLVLVEKADAIYDAESTDVLPGYDPQISATTNPTVRPPGFIEDLVVADNYWECASGEYKNYVTLDWDAPLSSVFDNYEVYANDGTGFDLMYVGKSSLYNYPVKPERLDIEHSFKVLAVSSTGKKKELGSAPTVTATPPSKTEPPSDVESLSIDITGEVLQLVWPRIPDCDLFEYHIRYSVEEDGDWLNSISLMRVDRNTTLVSTQARTGRYYIKAVDWAGNESENVATAYTTVPELFNLNVVETIEDPTFSGGFENTIKDAGSVFLRVDPSTGVYFTEGYYYYESFLDLGDVYTVRLQSSVKALGFTVDGWMEDWPLLSELTALSRAKSVDWEVETQYRSSEVFETMEDWEHMSDIEFIAGGNPENFTPWRKFIMGDSTGRIFQFRMKLTSKKTDVSPRVLGTKIRADMPDRIDSYNNILTSATVPVAVTYTPEFKGPGSTPNVQVTIDDGAAGDYVVFDSKTLTGLQISVFDKNGVQVSRQIDVVSKGYGRKSTSVI